MTSSEQITINGNVTSAFNEGSIVNLAGNNSGTQINYNYAPKDKQTLAEAAQEIQDLLEQLDKSYDINTDTGKKALTLEAMQHIKNDPTLAKRILSALGTGSFKAFEQFLNHPAASFVVGALENWEKTKGHPIT